MRFVIKLKTITHHHLQRICHNFVFACFFSLNTVFFRVISTSRQDNVLVLPSVGEMFGVCQSPWGKMSDTQDTLRLSLASWLSKAAHIFYLLPDISANILVIAHRSLPEFFSQLTCCINHSLT